MDDNVIKVSSFGGKLVSLEREERKLRETCDALISTILTHTNADPRLSDVIAGYLNIDDMTLMTEGLARIIGNASNRERGIDEEVEIVPFERDPLRFLAWSLAATSLSPNPNADVVAQAVKNLPDDRVQTYVDLVAAASRSLVLGT
jgi:hypothetical protein